MAQQFHVGRLIDHVHLRVADLQASRRFFAAVFNSLGFADVLVDGDGYFFADELFVDRADGPASARTTRATTARSCWIPTATTSRPSTTGRRDAPRTFVIVTAE